MTHDDPTLQELIVRALTGRDEKARLLFDRAASSDPELRQFYAELNEVVDVLAGSKDWRHQSPSPDLKAKIRIAVAEKMQSAPPRFNTVLLEADLGRRRAMNRLGLMVLAGLLVAGLLVWAALMRRDGDSCTRLSGNATYKASLKDNNVQEWARTGEVSVESSVDGLGLGNGVSAGALYLKKSYEGDHALAFEINVYVPAFDEQSNVVVFIAESEEADKPVFHEGARPSQALSLEISQTGMVLTDAEHVLLHSRPRSHPGAYAYSLRLEHLGTRVRALINGEVFFDGMPTRPLRGVLYPGFRLMGPQKNLVRFNNACVER